MKFLKEHTGVIIISVVSACIGVACGVVPYYAVASLITKMINRVTDIGAYNYDFLMIFLGFLFAVVFHEISTLTSHNLAFSVIESRRKAVVHKLAGLSMGEIEGKSSGQWTQFVTETLDKLERPIAHVIPEVIANLIIPLVLIVIIFTLDVRLGIANLLSVPFGMLFLVLMLSGYSEKSKRYQEASKRMHTDIVEYVKGINIIKAFNKSASSYGKYRESVENNKSAMLDWYLSVCFAITAAQEVFPSSLLFVVPTVLYLYMKGDIGVNTAVMAILLSYACYKPLIKAMSHMDIMANIGVILDEIKSVSDLKELERGKTRQKIDSYDVNFENVCFSYNDEKKLFENLSFTAKEGELTAIVGYSGGGKSSIAKLIAGFWNTKGGTIKIGNTDLKDIPIEQNMELVTYVSQENYLFKKSILENMRFAKADASLEEVKEACKKASCHDFIMSLPEKYDTLVGDSGGSLSGGERQRITIARALLKNSPIVLLDEATAYSDPDNEAEIQKSINALIKEKTVIMIAHRLSTIVNADKIIVIDKGSIEAIGKHGELLEKSKIYKEMWEAHIGANIETEAI